MLQETINNWKIYHNLYDSLEKWLNEGEYVLRRSSEEKFVCIKISLSLKYNCTYIRLRIIEGRDNK